MEKVFALILILLFLPLYKALSEVNVSDRAIFRIENKVYFISDLNKDNKQLNKLRCMKNNSVLLNALSLSSDDYSKILKLPTELDKLQSNKELLYRLTRLYKVQSFATNRKVSIDVEKLKEWGIAKCVGESWNKWPDQLKTLIKTELYLRDRFIIKDGKELDVTSLKSFLSSIDKKTKHFNFF